jgi:hypothetical protein
MIATPRRCARMGSTMPWVKSVAKNDIRMPGDAPVSRILGGKPRSFGQGDGAADLARMPELVSTIGCVSLCFPWGASFS